MTVTDTEDQRAAHVETVDGWEIRFLRGEWVAAWTIDKALSCSLAEGRLCVLDEKRFSGANGCRIPLTVIDALRRLPAWMPKAGDMVTMNDMPCAKPVKVREALRGWRFLLEDGSDLLRDCHVSDLKPVEAP